MLFNSYIFIFLFLPLVLVGYYGLNYLKLNRLSMVFLVGMSLWFYGYNNIYYLFILVGSVFINYLLSLGLHKSKAVSTRKILLWLGVIINIGILFYFKYMDFFIENVNTVLKKEYTLLHIVLPLGISFYTFQQVSFIIDCYKKECDQYSLLEYATYVTFFPQLIAGPIVYHSELIPQFKEEKNHRLNYENLSKGIYAFARGLGKKVLIADTLSKIVTIGYGNIGALNSVSAFVVMVCYALQIYFDFSGYCDMAYGIGYMFNVKLPVNFNSPYKAESMGDFWDRWHMTLTRFFTRYIYIPLGGSRRGTVRTYINVLIVFLISGFWHGAAWTFVVWGVINGIGVAIDRAIGKYWKKLPVIIKCATTFILQIFAWSLFRAASFSEAKALWIQLFSGGLGSIYEPITTMFNGLTESRALSRVGLGGIINAYPWLLVVIFILILLIVCFFLKNTQEKVEDMKYTGIRLGLVVLLMTWSIISLSEISEFLYFIF